MKAARIHGYNEPLVIEEVEAPQVKGPEGVLVKISGSGFCHSDLRIITGERKAPFEFPYIMGHENSGVIQELGPNVRAFKRGDPVLVYGAWGCRRCYACLSGNEQLCDSPTWPGVSREYQGGFAEYLYVPSNRYLIKVDDGDIASLAPLTDAALTAYRAVKKIARLRPDALSVMVIGIGGLGAYAVQFLKKFLPQNSTVIALDSVERKLDLAGELGADDARLAGPTPPEEIVKLTGGRGVDCIVDFVGSKSTLDFSLKSLGKQGAYIAVGLGGGALGSLTTTGIIRTELTLTGSRWGSYSELQEVYRLYKTNAIKVLGQKRKLEEINEVIEEMKRGVIEGRAVLMP